MAVNKNTSFTEPTLTNEMIVNNRSNLTIIITFSSTVYETYFNGKTLTCTCNGATLSRSVSMSRGGSVNQSFTFENIYHEDDGSKNVSWSWSCVTNTSMGTVSDSGIKALQVIPRASQPSVTNTSIDLGSNVIIETNRVSSSFTHNITYSIGNLTEQTRGLHTSSGVVISTTFTPPYDDEFSLAKQFPNTKSGVITITCKTYNGTTLIGTKTCTLTVNTIDNDTYRPSMQFSFTPINKYHNKYLNKVSGVTISATNSGKFNATISSYTISGPTKSSSNNPLAANPLDISMNTSSQFLTINGSVTDSRGYVKTIQDNTSIELFRYDVPQILQYSCQRCDINGDPALDGTYALVGITYTYQNDGYSNSMVVRKINIDNNDYNFTAQDIEESFDSTTGIVTGIGTKIVGNGNLDVSEHYDYILTCEDDVGSTTTILGRLTTSQRVMNILPEERGMAFGKFAEHDDILESAWPLNAPSYKINGDDILTYDTNAHIEGTTEIDNSGITLADLIEVPSNITKLINANKFETTETEIGMWLGSKLYRKVIDFGALPNNTTKTKAHGISNLNKIVSLKGYAYNSSSSTMIPLPYSSTTSSQTTVIYVNNSGINILTQYNASIYTESYIVLEYTKTT